MTLLFRKSACWNIFSVKPWSSNYALFWKYFSSHNLQGWNKKRFLRTNTTNIDIPSLVFFSNSTFSFELDSKFSSLVDDINAAASEAGIEPFARAKSIQEIKSMKALKDIQEITAMKEIKSIQEVPDNVAEKFIDVIICWHVKLSFLDFANNRIMTFNQLTA